MLTGIFVPNFTAFTESGDLDLGSTIEHAEWLLDTAISGLVPFGTTGEGASLSLDEMKAVTAELMRVKGGKPIIPTLTTNSLGTIREFLTWLSDTDVTHVMVLPPSYFRPADSEGMVALFDQITRYTSCQVIAYNIPPCGNPVAVDVLTHTSVWGVKDSGGDIAESKAYLATGKNLLVGVEKYLVPALEAGACGGILGLANLYPNELTHAYDLFTSGDAAGAQKVVDGVVGNLDAVMPRGSSIGAYVEYAKALSKHVIPTDLGYVRLPLKQKVLKGLS
jgi:dihydrodipicolinate synthase/N-acetylneuraminate lyase